MARTDPRPNYGTKRRVRADGYVDIYEPDHPAGRRDGYVFEHRKVAWDSGLLADVWLDIHHINGDRADNRLENLQVLTPGEHKRLHMRVEGVPNQYGTWTMAETPEERRIRNRDWMRAKRARMRKETSA